MKTKLYSLGLVYLDAAKRVNMLLKQGNLAYNVGGFSPIGVLPKRVCRELCYPISFNCKN